MCRGCIPLLLFGLWLVASISGRLCFFLEPTPHKTESEAIVNGSGSLDWALRSRERQGDGRSKDWPSAQAGSRRQQYRATYCDSSTTHKGHRPTQPSKTITSQPLPLSWSKQPESLLCPNVIACAHRLTLTPHPSRMLPILGPTKATRYWQGLPVIVALFGFGLAPSIPRLTSHCHSFWTCTSEVVLSRSPSQWLARRS